MADIASPAEPVPPAPGQPASPVAPIVPGQFSSSTAATARIGLLPGLSAADYSGDFAGNYFKDLYGRMGIAKYTPSPEGYYRARTLPELADQFLGVPNQPTMQTPGMEGPRISGPTDLDFWLRPYSPGMRGASAQRALHEGFADTPIGALLSWRSMRQAIGDTVEEGYDPFRDRQIADAGMTNQMSLFYGSQGREHTRWLINHVREKQREAEWASHGGVVEQALGFAGGILGDPANLLPGNIGLKGVSILNRMREGIATGNEMRIIAAGRVAYGSLGDGLRTAGWQAGAMIASRALANQLDPTIPGDISADLILPSVIAGSLGVIQGVSARRAGRKLAEQVHDPDFLKPTPPAPPEPRRSFLGSEVVDTVQARTRPVSEFVETIPKHAQALGDQAPTPPSNGGNFPAGALNTDYGPMRVREHQASSHAAGFTEPTVGAPRLAASRIFEADEGMTRLSPRDLSPGMVGGKPGFEESLVITPDGQLWHLNQKSFDLAKEQTDMPVGQHNILGIRYGHLTDQLVRVTTYGDEIAAQEAKAGTTPQQKAVMQRIRRIWETQGKGDQATLWDKEGNKIGPAAAEAPTSPITENNHWLDERGKPITAETKAGKTVTDEGAHQPGSVGAQLSPTSLAYQESVLLAQGRLVPTGIGLEKMPLNPIFRAFQGASVAAMRFVSDLAATGGVITRANAEGIANLPPVEVLYQMNWNKRLVDTLRYQQDQWSAYRHKVAGAADTSPNAVNIEGRSDWKRTGEQVGTAIKDRIMPGEPGLSFEQFRIRVAEAQNKGDVDAVSDAATPYVNASAAKFRADIYEHAKGRAVETGVFDEVYREALDQAHADIEAIKKEAKDMAVRSHVEKWTPDQRRLAEEALMARQEDAEFKYNQQKKQLDNLRDHGPLLNGTAQSYRPRLWDTGKMLDDEQGFFDKVVPWFQSQAGGSLDLTEAVRITKQIHELLSHQNPIFDRGDMKALFQSVAGPTSAHARSFTIPDELVKDFLVNDSETLARYHTQQMGKAIEFKERFGSLDAREQIAEIEQDYRRQIIEANKGATEPTELAKQLTNQMKTAIADAQALRDKFYGTYGASPDPHRWDSRTIRMAKQFNNLTMLGMSGISALGDLIRPVMTEGIDAVYGYGIRSLMSESRAIIMRMNKQELELEGNGMELALNVRAMAAADTGDIFGSRGKFEHGLNQANAWNFVLNGLNGVNQIDKEWARLSIGGRVNNILLDLAAEDLGGGALRLSETDRARFAAAGIDEVIGRRIGLQIKIHGRDFGNITMPNTTAWTDEYARDVYRSAMNQFVNRTVPTPGIGDRPNWASTEWGGLISQYKSFGMGSLIRGGISGLQEGGNRFWYGAAATVGFAILLNEVRSQLFYDKSTFDKPAPAVIVDGIDRSGILGWFSDINRAVETLSGHRLGVKPMMGAGGTPVTPTLPQIAGTLGGPTAGQAGRIVSVANDYMSGHPTAQTMRNWRALVPGGNNPVLDPALDRLLPGSYPKRGSEPRAAPPQAGGG